jgi:hypothetical protein
MLDEALASADLLGRIPELWGRCAADRISADLANWLAESGPVHH